MTTLTASNPTSARRTAVREAALVPTVAACRPGPRASRFGDVCDLIAAAGPLTVRNIAGGLDISVRSASAIVRKMAERHLLRQDEFDRYGQCAGC